MQIYNIHEAKTHLSRLIELAAKGEPFVIAKAGKPLVKVMALSAPEPSEMKRTGFMAGEITIPEDFDRMGSKEIEEMFGLSMILNPSYRQGSRLTLHSRLFVHRLSRFPADTRPSGDRQSTFKSSENPFTTVSCHDGLRSQAEGGDASNPARHSCYSRMRQGSYCLTKVWLPSTSELPRSGNFCARPVAVESSRLLP